MGGRLPLEVLQMWRKSILLIHSTGKGSCSPAAVAPYTLTSFSKGTSGSRGKGEVIIQTFRLSRPQLKLSASFLLAYNQMISNKTLVMELAASGQASSFQSRTERHAPASNHSMDQNELVKSPRLLQER